MNWEWLTSNWLGILSLIATGIIATVAVVAQRLLQKQHQINGVLDAFKILNSRDHRESRKKLYELYREYEQSNDLGIFEDKAEVEDVRADFDVIGILVKSGNIDKELIMIEYGPLAYRCWNYLEKHVKAERQKRNFGPFMKNFEWLADEAHKYWKDKKKDLSETKLYD